jgi:PadR family transcriptional regulator PadR
VPRTRKRTYRHLPAFVLLALADGPLHGGAIHAALLARMPGFKADTGAVYRTLQRLENDGEVRAEWDTSIPGPARRIYRLTPTGWQKLDAWKGDIEHRIANLRYFLDAYARVQWVRDGRRTRRDA